MSLCVSISSHLFCSNALPRFLSFSEKPALWYSPAHLPAFCSALPPPPTKTLRVAFLQEGFEESPQSIRNYRQIMFAILKVHWLNLSREKNTGEGSEIIKAQIQSQHIKSSNRRKNGIVKEISLKYHKSPKKRRRIAVKHLHFHEITIYRKLQQALKCFSLAEEALSIPARVLLAGSIHSVFWFADRAVTQRTTHQLCGWLFLERHTLGDFTLEGSVMTATA